jgi:HAD superfamily hydrolase (TIGR01509 family)
MARIRAVLFDIDGTLLDSNGAHAHAWLDALRGVGRSVPLDVLRKKIGMGGDKLLADVAGIEKDSTLGKAIDEHRTDIFKMLYLSDVGPFRDARALVERLRARGLVVAAVSSATAADLADLLRCAGVADRMDHVISSDDADASKPDPDLVEIALDRIGVEAEETLMIGDTPYDIEAAARAGVKTIAVRCGGWDDDSLGGAVAIYDDPADLLANLERSPLLSDTAPLRRAYVHAHL